MPTNFISGDLQKLKGLFSGGRSKKGDHQIIKRARNCVPMSFRSKAELDAWIRIHTETKFPKQLIWETNQKPVSLINTDSKLFCSLHALGLTKLVSEKLKRRNKCFWLFSQFRSFCYANCWQKCECPLNFLKSLVSTSCALLPGGIKNSFKLYQWPSMSSIDALANPHQVMKTLESSKDW